MRNFLALICFSLFVAVVVSTLSPAQSENKSQRSGLIGAQVSLPNNAPDSEYYQTVGSLLASTMPMESVAYHARARGGGS